MRKERGSGRAREERVVGLLVDVCCEDAGLAEIVSRHGVSVEGLARWAGRAGNVAMLERLRDLLVLRGVLRIARARAEAASALLRLATEGSPPETARKACVDLLNLKIDIGEVMRAGSAGAEIGAEREAALRRVLERLGKSEEATEQGVGGTRSGAE